MVKTIVHIADLHIRTLNLQEKFIDVANIFLDEMEAIKPDRIVIVGDLVHQKITISNELVSTLSWFLWSCANICKTVLVPGNHDLLLRNTDRLDSITPIVNAMNNDNILYLKDSGLFEDDNVVWVNYSVFDECERPEWDGKKKRGKRYIGLYHAPLVSSTTDKGFSFDEGKDVSIFEGLDFVLLGDIHKRQELKFGKTKAVYPGSFYQNDYGENISGHGYLVWDVKKKSYTSHDIHPGYGFYKFKLNGLGGLGSEKLVNL